MGKHYTRNTISAAKWCRECKAFTQHKVQDRRVTHCIPCAEKQELECKTRKPKENPPPVLQREFKF